MYKHNPIQAIMVFYLYVKFEIDWSNGFQVRVRKPHPDRHTDGQMDRRTDGRRTHQSNRRIGYTQPAQKLKRFAIIDHTTFNVTVQYFQPGYENFTKM